MTGLKKISKAFITSLVTALITLYIMHGYINNQQTMFWWLENNNFQNIEDLLRIDFNSGQLISRSDNWMLRFIERPIRSYFVQDQGTLLERIHNYNQAIQELKERIWSARQHPDWSDISKSINVVLGSDDDFLIQLSNFPHLRTVMLPWKGSTEHNTGKIKWSSFNDTENLLVQEYYTWTASDPLCQWLGTKGDNKIEYVGVYNKSCTLDVNASKKAISLDFVYMRGKPIKPKYHWPNDGDLYPDYFFTTLPVHVFYLHIAEDALITKIGDIYSKNLKLVPYTCGHETKPDPPQNYTRFPIYNDVFIVSQYWCNGFFHKMLECLPRIAPYVEFLQSNKDIMIHVSETKGTTAQILGYLGIDKKRLIGGVSRAKVVYMPQGTPCGFPVPMETQILSMHLKEAFRKNYPNRHANMSVNYLVLIKRSHSRKFYYQKQIEKTMEKVAKDYNLTYKLFPDNPVPPMDIAMAYFNGAKVVVAPHGAGLANMLFCKPGTLIIEGLCNHPHVRMCFQWSAHGLGMRYHGIPSEEKGCLTVNKLQPKKLDFAVRTYMDTLKL